MHNIDLIILLVMLALPSLLVWSARRVRGHAQIDVFLGGRLDSWWQVGLIGCGGTFDLAAMLFVIGGYIAFGVGAVWFCGLWMLLSGAMLAAFSARAERRCLGMSFADWLAVRMGHGVDAAFARVTAIVYGLSMVLGIVVLCCWTASRIMAWLMPELPPWLPAVLLVALALSWILPAGFTGLARATLPAAVLLHLALGGVAVFAFISTTPEQVAMVTPADWTRMLTPTQALMAMEDFLPMETAVVVYLVMGFLLCAGGAIHPGDSQQLLSGFGVRDATLGGAIWGVLGAVRLAGYAGVALLAYHLWFRTPGGTPFDALAQVLLNALGPVARGLVLGGILLGLIGLVARCLHAGAVMLAHDVPHVWSTHRSASEVTQRVMVTGVCMLALACGALGVWAEHLAPVLRWLALVALGGAWAPQLLRWTWWRYNALAYGVGMTYALFAPVIVLLLWPEQPLYAGIGWLALGAIPVNALPAVFSPPPTMSRLRHFYKTVQPPGRWGAVQRDLARLEPEFQRQVRSRRDLLNVALLGVSFMALYAAAVLLVAHQVGVAISMLGVVLMCGCLLYRTWYCVLPKD